MAPPPLPSLVVLCLLMSMAGGASAQLGLGFFRNMWGSGNPPTSDWGNEEPPNPPPPAIGDDEEPPNPPPPAVGDDEQPPNSPPPTIGDDVQLTPPAPEAEVGPPPVTSPPPKPTAQPPKAAAPPPQPLPPIGGPASSTGGDDVITSGDGVFNVVSYGAVAGGTEENSKAFMDAWKATCAHQGPAVFLVPEGTFLLGQVTFQGPCFNNHQTRVMIKGTLKALPDPSSFTSLGWIEFVNLHDVVIKGGGTLDGQGAQSWSSNNCKLQKKCSPAPITMRLTTVNNGTLSDLSFLNSKGFHLNLYRCVNVEASFLTITAPGNSPNTDGIHISTSDSVTVSHVSIGTGDDCISIGAGVTNLKIGNVSCGPGHGISVGSLGKYANEKDVSGVKVKNCTLSGTTNGLRIKTWPGSPAGRASNISFEDIIVENVANPIIIDQEYCPSGKCKPQPPSMVKLEGIAFRRVIGTSRTQVAVNMVCSESLPCKDVLLEDIHVDYVGAGEPSSNCANVHASFAGSQLPTPCS